MKKLTWWCRIVGGFNLLVGATNLMFILAASKMLEDTLPYAKSADLGRAFGDAWFAFVMDSLVVGVALIWVSRNPRKNIAVVWLAIALEVFHGLVHEGFLIARGYKAADYIPIMVIQLVIIITGVVFARQASVASEVDAPAGSEALAAA